MCVRISTICRGVIVRKHYSVTREWMRDVQARPLSRAEVGAGVGGSASVCSDSATAGIALSQAQHYTEPGPELGPRAGYPPASAADTRAAGVFVQYLGILFKIISFLSQ